MRTGAIFARGSCRALRWMALAGMAFALGGGQAAAQVTPDYPMSLTEGDPATIDVEFETQIPVNGLPGTLTLTVSATNATPAVQIITFTHPGNTTTSPVVSERTESFTITPESDDDAEDGPDVGLTFTLLAPLLEPSGGGGSLQPPGNQTLMVEDDETQGYYLQLLTREADLEEGKLIEYRIGADPAFTGGSETLSLELSEAYGFTGDVTAATVLGRATVTLDSTDSVKTISYTATADADSANQYVTLTAYWGTRSEGGEVSNRVLLTDPDEPDAGDLTFTQTSIAPIPAVVGTPITMQLPTVATGGTPPYTYMATGLPPGLTVSLTGMLSGTPTMARATAYTGTYTASDNASPALTGSLSLSITVAAAGTPPPTRDSGEGNYTLTASASMTEGQSLVPVSVRYTVPAAASGTRSATVTITVSVLQRAATDGLTPARERIYESEDPPVTRAELSGATAGVVNEVVALGTTTDVEWLVDPSRDDGDIVYTNAVAGQAFFVFDYGEGAFDETHTAYLRTNRDTDAEDELFKLVATDTEARVTPLRAGADRQLVTLDDVQSQTYELDFPGNNSPHEIDEGDPAGLELAPVPPRTVEMLFNVTLSAVEDVTDYSLDDDPAAISQNYTSDPGTIAGRVRFTVNTSPNDGDRKDDTVTVTARTTNQAGRQRDLETLDIEVLDQHMLPNITITKITIPNAAGTAQVPAPNGSIPEGTVGTVTLTADRSPTNVPNTEDVTVTLKHGAASTADEGDYTLPSPVVIKGSATNNMMTGTFKVDVDEDEDINLDAPESLVLGADVEGSAANGPNPSTDDPHVKLAAIPFTNTTMAQISAKTYPEIEAAVKAARTAGAGPNALWEPGEKLTLEAEDLFDYAATASVVLGNFVADDPAKLSGATSDGMVTITAMGDGESAISITATVVGASSSLEIDQTTSNVVTVKFPITVDPEAITKMPPANVTTAVTAAIKKAADMASSKQWEPDGATAMVALSDLFDVPDSIRAIYDAESSDMGDIEAGISSDKMYVTLMPKSAGTATITVTAADTASGGGTATVSFDATVVAQAAIVAKSQAEVNKVFMDADADELVAGGSAVMVDMSKLFTVAPGVTPTYTTRSSAAAVGANASGTMLTLTPGSAGSAKITVTARSGDKTATVSADVTVGLSDLTVTVTAEPMEIMEGATSTVTATASRPVAAADGEVKIELDVVGDATLDMESITIAAGSSDGSVTLTATEDDDDYENETVVVIASGKGISGATRITITVEDDDEAPGSTIRAKDNAADLIAAAVNAVAGGAEWMVGGMVAQVDMSTLFEVDEGVTPIYAGTSSADAVKASSSGNMLMLTPAAAGSATITVTASDSAGESSARVLADVTVALQALVVTVTASANAVDEGGSVTLTAKANRDVTADREVSLQVVGDAAAVEVADSITIAAGADMGEATLMAVEDDDTQNANVTVVASGAGIATPITMDIAVTDNDRTVNAKSQADVDAVFMVAIGGDFLPGGDAVSVDMSGLFTTNGSPTVEYEAMSSNEESVMASASGSMLTLTPGETGDATITVTATDTRGDAADTATVSSTVTIGVLPLEITSVTASASEVAEGGTVEITATANKMVDANVEVMLVRDATSAAGDDDYTLTPTAMITIMAGETMGKVTLTATDDIETEPAESLTLVARHKDLGDVATVMVTIMASDPKSMFTLSGPTDMNLVEGRSYELTVTADPAVQADTEVPVMRDRAASDADDADFTVASVMLKAGDTSGTTNLMVADDGLDDSGVGMPEALVLYIADGGDNQRLSFNIWDAAVPALPVIAQLLLAAFLALGGYRRYRRR